MLKPWESPQGQGLQLRPHLQNQGRGLSCSQVLHSGYPREPTEQHTGLALAPSSPRRAAPEAGLGPVTALPAPDRPTHPAWCWEAWGPPAFPQSGPSSGLIATHLRPTPSPRVWTPGPACSLLDFGFWVGDSVPGQLSAWLASAGLAMALEAGCIG